MGIGTSLFLIALGAIFYWAVEFDISGLEISTIGLILMIVGGIGLLISMLYATSGEEAGAMRPLLSDNPMWEAFGNRALVLAIDRGADFGECVTTVGRVGAGTVDDWYREWVATADRIAAIGDASAAAGHRVSAREAYYRACNYYRSAYFPLYGAPTDPRLGMTG